MELTVAAARELLTAVGLPGASAWPAERLQKKLNGLAALEAELEQLTEPAGEVLYAVLAANHGGEEVQVTESTVGQAVATAPHGAATATKPRGRPKGSGKGGKVRSNGDGGVAGRVATKARVQVAKAGAEKAGRDRFGNRLGTRAALINEALARHGKTGLTVKEIFETTGASAIGSHLTSLKKRGLVLREGKKWKVAK